MRLTTPIDAGLVVEDDRIYSHDGISVPMAHRVSVPVGIWAALGAHILRKLPPVHPDRAKYPLVLIQDHHAARHRSECDSSGFVRRGAWKPERIARRPGIIGFLAEGVWKILLELSLPQRRQGRLFLHFRRERPGPKPGEIALGSGAPRVAGRQ